MTLVNTIEIGIQLEKATKNENVTMDFLTNGNIHSI